MGIISFSNSGTDVRGGPMQREKEGEFPELSLMEGGPGDALMKKLRLIRPEFGAASARTAIILAALTWLPLLVFSLIEGLALGGARIPRSVRKTVLSSISCFPTLPASFANCLARISWVTSLCRILTNARTT